jgi:hypothetical protein
MSTINDLSVTSTVDSSDQIPIWQTANGVTRRLPVSVLDGRYLTQADIALLAISPATESFISSILPNPTALPTFIAGTTLAITLKGSYLSPANIEVFFDTGFQGPEQFTLVGNTLAFISPIPVGVQNVYVRGGSTRLLGAPSAGTVTDATVAPGSKLANRINTVNVLDPAYAADPTGVRDSTTAFQAAVNTGRQVIVPTGTYVMGQITIPSNTAILGEGNSTVIKPITGFSTNAFWVTLSAASNIEIGNMQFNLPVATFSTTVPIFVQQGSFHRFHDIYMPAGGQIGVFMVDNMDTLIENCEVASVQQHSFQSTGLNSARNKIVKCKSGTTVSGHGISIVAGTDHDVLECISSGANGFGISYFQTLRGRACNNRSGNSADEGMQITDSNFVIFSNNTLTWDVAGVSTDLGISLAAQTTGFTCIGNKIQGNFIAGNSASGIALASTNFGTGTTPIAGPGLPVQDCDISNNTIINCSVDVGGGLVNGHGAGVLMYGSQCQNNTVQNNTIVNTIGTMLYGVAEFNVSSEWGPPANNRIANNAVYGASIAPVLKVGSTTEALTSGWQPWTPTITSASGTFTSITLNTASYYETEKNIDFVFKMTINTNGTAAGSIGFTLPPPFSANFGSATGRETLTGKALICICGGATGVIRFFDNTYPGADGSVIQVTGSFTRP